VVAPSMAAIPLESVVWAALHDVHDPEIPTISVVDLGVIRSVTVGEGSVRVELLPTFVGCPAINVLQESITERLRELADEVSVDISFAEPWTTERITDAGRAALRAAGFAPPPGDDLVAECPYCGSRETRMENLFGPTLCRSIYYCQDCRQPFEQFKLV
jgi:ring-1,2-phenylacetyl-CoA epoxidase subunit PaaD